jgi:hypothetical protein
MLKGTPTMALPDAPPLILNTTITGTRRGFGSRYEDAREARGLRRSRATLQHDERRASSSSPTSGTPRVSHHRGGAAVTPLRSPSRRRASRRYRTPGSRTGS